MAADFIVKTMSADEASWWRQNSYWIAERDRNTERANAIRRGLAEGRKKGLAEGERNARLEAARRFLKMGLSVEQIAEGVCLSVDEVRSLQEP